jgi:hypothetical protein
MVMRRDIRKRKLELGHRWMEHQVRSFQNRQTHTAYDRDTTGA